MKIMPTFDRYIGIDYSGAKTPSDSLSGLRVNMAAGEALPAEVLPPPSPRKYWTRRGLAEWLVETLKSLRQRRSGSTTGFPSRSIILWRTR